MPNPADMPGAQPSPITAGGGGGGGGATASFTSVSLPQEEQPAPQPGAPEATPKADAPKPPWGSDEEFNPQRAWDLIQNLRGDIDKHKAATDPIVAEHERLRRASMEEADRLKEDNATLATRESTWRSEAVRSKAEALATGKFIDTDTALALIGDLSVFATDTGVDVDSLTAALELLAVNKPFLVAQPPAQGLRPNKAQGQSGTGPIPLDMQIKAAQERGDLATSIALKQQMKYAK